MNDNFKIFLQAIIDDSSLNKVQKDLARKKLEIQADIDFSNFAKSKADIEKQFRYQESSKIYLEMLFLINKLPNGSNSTIKKLNLEQSRLLKNRKS